MNTNNANTFSIQKHVVEDFVEKHYQTAHSLMTQSYLDGEVFYDEYNNLLLALSQLPEHPQYFHEWLLEDDAALSINLMEIIVIGKTISNTFKQVSPLEGNHVEEFLA